MWKGSQRPMHRTTALFLVGLLCAGCGSSDPRPRIAFDLSLAALPALGSASVYQGWAVVDGIPVTTGRFVIDASVAPARVTSPDGIRIYGTTSRSTFGPAATGLGQDFPRIVDATHFFITIESRSELSLRPSGNVILAGPIIGDAAELAIFGEEGPGSPKKADGSAPLGGTAMLTSPTGGGNPWNGVWFTTTPAFPGGPSLDLPVLAREGLLYEGWVMDVIGGVWLSLGKFSDPGFLDLDAQTSPTRGLLSAGLLAPGQDFIFPAVAGAATPLFLADGTMEAFITLEPVPDNSPAPFPLRLLSAPIPAAAVGGTGAAALEIPMTAQPTALPLLQIQGTPSFIQFAGQAPASPGGETAGRYVIYLKAGESNLVPLRFTVSETGAVFSSPAGIQIGDRSSFAMNATNTGLFANFPDITAATEICIAVEPQGFEFPAASTPVLMRGFLLAGQGLATTSVLGDFLGISGSFVTMTPTNDGPGVPIDDGFGIWWRALGAAVPTLVLPTPPAGWTYEGWVAGPGLPEPVSTGKFRHPDRADEDSATFPGRGPGPGFPVPGQDFVQSHPGIAIPAMLDLRSAPVMVTLEPSPDDAPGPYAPIIEGVLPSTVQIPSDPLAEPAGGLPRGTLSFDR